MTRDVREPTVVLPDIEREHLHDVTLRWSDAGLLLACYVVLVVAWSIAGQVIVGSSAMGDRDQSVAEWFVEQRTPTLDTLSVIGSGLADTAVKVVVTGVLAAGMWSVWRRWREPLMMVVPLVLEASAFITVTHLVGRPRPAVERLESSPVDSSFPSGHVAAAAAYAAIVVVVFWQTPKRWARALVVVVAAAIPVMVAFGRLYRGMHFLSDVVAGVLLGLVSVAVSWWIIRRAVCRTAQQQALNS